MFLLCHPCSRSILFKAIMKGVLYCFSMSIHSNVWGIMPSLMFITKMAISARFPPRFLNEVKAAWPGVSMKSSPGMVRFNFSVSRSLPHSFLIISKGILLEPICWVIFPASVLVIELCLI